MFYYNNSFSFYIIHFIHAAFCFYINSFTFQSYPRNPLIKGSLIVSGNDETSRVKCNNPVQLSSITYSVENLSIRLLGIGINKMQNNEQNNKTYLYKVAFILLIQTHSSVYCRKLLFHTARRLLHYF